ncbi:B3 DNA binding domain containing protein [Trema orientale]|uniref:B3 DNA binding domain containing protein n=1 Tax=Trema orientale TaxID=63057 RepID=A0A2P5FXY3_TREOI|nr:B3 DNA binding domain containing protein [Trema orientale]
MTLGSPIFQKKFCSTSPHFFKIILEETIGNKKLQIPKKFVTKYGGSLSSRVFLKLPCGSRWKIGVTKSDGKVWIDEGWKSFADYYSLSRGDLVVFRYEGNSQFHVILFDTSTVERDYLSNPNHFQMHFIDGQSHEFVKEETEDDVSVQVLDRVSPSPNKTRAKSPLACSRPHKKMKTSPFVKTQSDLSPLRSKVKFDLSDEEVGDKSIPPRSMKLEHFAKKQTLNAKQKAEALKRASGFKSKDPFFMVAMQPSFVGDKSAMILPSLFATKYLRSKNMDVILKVSDGRTWSVKYSFRLWNGSPKAKFDRGWKAFARENDLKVGDVCVFVLTKRTGILFEVTIFSENGVANSNVLPEFEVMPKGSLSIKLESDNTMNKITAMSTPWGCRKPLPSSSGVSRASKAASHFFSTNPHFQVVVQPGHLDQCIVHVPASFAKSFFNKRTQIMTLQVGTERSWPVKLLAYPSESEYKFSAGWAAFAKENSLMPRDICIFELIKRNQVVLKVSIFRQTGLA